MWGEQTSACDTPAPTLPSHLLSLSFLSYSLPPSSWRKSERKPEHSGVAEMSHASFDGSKKKSTDLECVVEYIDGTCTTFFLPKNAEGSKLYDLAFAFIGLNDEREYFGLRIDDKLKPWVDPTKPIRKQCRVSPPYRFLMRVKFFSAEPQKLRDEYTRYLFVLQLRKQLERGTLQCTDNQVAAELAAFLLQGEFGAYDPRQHTPAFVSTIPFYPHDRQTETLELAILQEYKKLRSHEWTPEEADRIFLDRVRFLPNYGVDMHTVKGKDNENYTLGLTPTGILVYEDEEKIGLFVWSMILKLDMHGKKLKLVVAEENEQACAEGQKPYALALLKQKLHLGNVISVPKTSVTLVNEILDNDSHVNSQKANDFGIGPYLSAHLKDSHVFNACDLARTAQGRCPGSSEKTRKVMEHTFVFVLPDVRGCKHLWKSAVEHHAFFRLRGIPKPPSKLQQFFRLKSRFYASFRTEHQLAQENSFGSSSFRRRNTSTGQSLRSDASAKALSHSNGGHGVSRSNSSFKRVSTRRVAARPSFVNRSSGRIQSPTGSQVPQPPTRPVRPPTVEDSRAHSPINPNSSFVRLHVLNTLCEVDSSTRQPFKIFVYFIKVL
ncbi:hypothetical protein ACTXT7_011704 [Hymenolepis weldensis]